MSTTFTPIPAQVGTTDAILPAKARVWVYRVAIALGALVFVAAIVLKATGHGTINGVALDPETGIVALVLAALGALAHANLSTGPGILAAIEDAEPKVGEVVSEVETEVKQVVKKAKAAETVDPELAGMLVKDVRAEAKRLKIPGYTSKSADVLRVLITSARKGA